MTKKIIIAAFLLSLVIIPLVTQAEPIIDPGSAAYKTGDYELSDILTIIIGASRWILGIVGSLTLVMFIYGGFTFLISAGSKEKIEKARKIIVAAIIGLIIVFASYVIIQFVLKTLGLDWKGNTDKMELIASENSISQNRWTRLSLKK